MKKIIDRLLKSKILGRICHTLNYCLQRELKNYESVLDLGCGMSSPLQFCRDIKYSVGVEVFTPYLEESKKKKIHTEYISKKIEEVEFLKDSFDAVIMIEVLEHLPEEEGFKILKKADIWARRKVIISTPNGYFPMGAVDGNSYQKHRSAWDVEKLNSAGFKCFGLSGAKCFYLKENTVESLFSEDTYYANIKFRPKKFFYLLNGIVQIFTYYNPRLAFGLFAVKEK